MSALQLKIEVAQFNSKILLVTSTTAVYDVVNNPSGWGVNGDANIAPNIADIADIGETPGIIFLLEMGGVKYSYSATSIIRSQGWPNLTRTPLALIPENFGLTVFPDGKCTVTAQVAGNHEYDSGSGILTEGFTSVTTVIIYLTAQAECCVSKMAHGITKTDGNFCDDDAVKLFNEAQTLLAMIQQQVIAKEWQNADENLARLQALCISQKSSCNGCP